MAKEKCEHFSGRFEQKTFFQGENDFSKSESKRHVSISNIKQTNKQTRK